MPAITRTPRVGVVVLNWNGGRDTLDCIQSIQQSRCRFDLVVLADNGSTDGSVAAVREKFPDVVIVENGSNLGFAAGNNRGIQVALDRGADFVLLLNNDATIDAAALSHLLDAATTYPKAGVFSGKILFADGSRRLWYAGARWQRDKQFFEHVGYGQEDAEQYSIPSVTDYASGCAMFVRADVFKQIGLLDERFFLTYEESDFCYRARSAGYESMYVPDAVFEHKVSASFGGENTPLHDYFYTRNILLWAERHLSRREFFRLLMTRLREVLGVSSKAGHLISAPRRLLWVLQAAGRRACGRAPTPSLRARYLGLRDYLLRRFGDCPQEVRDLRRPRGQEHVA